jgi:KaiC/GvpD/RAD55 family RecA-like ATPase
MVMHNFDRKLEEAGARVNQKVADVTERLERETAELITYLNNEVVPAIRAHSTKALRVAADKLAKMADYLDEQKRSRL